MKQKGFFDEEDSLRKLSKLGDPLEKLNEFINWEGFRGLLNKKLNKNTHGPGGRPPFDYVMMFKILILQKLYNMADDKTEFQINDRLSFRRFLQLGLHDTIPDSKTIWNFSEELKNTDVIEKLFKMFNNELEEAQIITHSGSIVDATFFEVPRQRNTREENKQIKEGNTPDEWKKEKNKNKLAQKDIDARWVTKNKKRHYGYKDHIKIDKKSKLITTYRVTSAEVHDSQELKNLIEKKKDKRIYGDSAYTGEEVQKFIPKRIMNRIHEKGYRNRPLTKTQIRNNTAKSRIRARVEHIFATMTQFGGKTIRTIGMARAEIQIGLLNLAYNLKRYVYLVGTYA